MAQACALLSGKDAAAGVQAGISAVWLTAALGQLAFGHEKTMCTHLLALNPQGCSNRLDTQRAVPGTEKTTSHYQLSHCPGVLKEPHEEAGGSPCNSAMPHPALSLLGLVSLPVWCSYSSSSSLPR